MEEKLKAYRVKRSRQELFQRTKAKVTSVLDRMLPGDSCVVETNKEDDEQDAVESIVSETSVDEKELCDENTWGKLILYGSLWAFLYILAIHAEFGAVYFIISLLYIIWKNTRTGPKSRGEVSAYSVFNPNCEAIDGTLKAEQFEKEIRYGGLL